MVNAMAEINPLNQTDCECIEAVLEAIEPTRQFLQNCKDCDLQVDEQIKELARQEKVAKAIKTLFIQKPV